MAIKLEIPFGFLDIYIHDQYYSISVNNSGTPTVIMEVLMLAVLVVWAAAYFRLKEKQV